DHADAGIVEADDLAGLAGEIDHPLRISRVAVVDAHDHALAGIQIDDAHARLEGQGGMRRGESLLVETLAAGGVFAAHAWSAVPTRRGRPRPAAFVYSRPHRGRPRWARGGLCPAKSWGPPKERPPPPTTKPTDALNPPASRSFVEAPQYTPARP